MRVVRTYPIMHPETLRGRARVEDEIERCYISDYDNRSLLDFKSDVLVLEWDIALSREDLESLVELCRGYDDVLSVPYRLYFESDVRIPKTGVWSSQILLDPVTLASRWVRSDDLTCDMFGFGCTFVPYRLLLQFVEDGGFRAGDSRMTDTNFSLWHYRRISRKVPLLWDFKPVHLHYDPNYAISEAV